MPNHNFDEIFIGRENRKSNYRTWSERAVVVGFNAENNSYNVVITTEKTLGDNVRTLNRIIRNVKSVLRPSVKTFFPGETIIVGYVDDRREHPIIVGEGDSAGHTCIKVTLGIDTNLPVIEGPSAPSLVEPQFTPTPCPSDEFLTDSLTGSTTTLVLDCDTLDITGCFRAEIEAPSGCGCGVYDWSLSGGLAGFTISDQGAAATAIGSTTTLALLNEAGTQLKICPPTNNIFVVGRAYRVMGRRRDSRAGDSCPPPDSDCECVEQTAWCRVGYRCNGDPIAGDVTPGVCTGAELIPACTGVGTQPCNSVPIVCHGNSAAKVSCCSGSPGNETPCGPLACLDFGSGGPSAVCAIANDFGIGQFCDQRTQQMIDDGCFPCIFAMSNTTLTATDACGVLRTIEIRTESEP